MAGSSKLNPWSLDKSHILETEIEYNQLNKSDGVGTNKSEKNFQGPISRTLAWDQEYPTLTCTRKELTGSLKWDGSVMSPIPLRENRVIPLTANKFVSTGDVEGIVFSNFLKQISIG
ncbi:hypothetical protein F3Y22_tig00110174pilonHSYRG00094 [Hibiscus syriacus]|uniref:Uncharacterized protein n=1 Tax=Hibiscus syriacus TaxID=106335 RepID=A0A6A3BKJ8_HIBSY|nr:hypothetical protein F3Y22_tig00110174pilonHSYRG00094 [Hibiscus syriacus]